MSYTPLSTIKFGDSWAVADARLEDKPMLIRIRSGLEDLCGHPDLSARLRVVWEYSPDDESGLPNSADLRRMTKCEDLLSESLESGNHAVMTHVLTCNGLRQWIFYTSDLESSARRINDALPHDPPFPIEMSAESDHAWSEFRETMKNVGL